MPNFSLKNILISNKCDSEIITDDAISFGQFKIDIANAICSISSINKPRVTLFEADTYRFMVWLFASWSMKRTVLIPSEIDTFSNSKFYDHILIGTFKNADLINWGNFSSHETFTELDLEANVLEVYTSGSTGEPTKISKKLWQLENEIEAAEFSFGKNLPSNPIFTGSASHQHFFGLPFRVLWPLVRGSKIARNLISYPHEWDTSISQVFITSPSFLKRVAQTTDIKKQSKANFICCFAAGGKLDLNLSEEIFKLTSSHPIEIYGSSETGHISYKQSPLNKWIMQKNVEFKKPIDQTLEIRSKFLPNDNWYKTADLAIEVGTSFELQGRSDTILKIEDKRISVSQIKKAIIDSKLVNESHILDFGNGSRDKLSAVVVLNDSGVQEIKTHGKLAVINSIKNAMLFKVDPIGIPRRWRFASSIPRNSFGKISRSQCETLFSSSLKSPTIIDIREKDQIYIFALEITDSLDCLKGHFDKFPVIPGVAQIQWAIDIVLNHLSPEKIRFSSMEQVKFRDLLKPNQIVELEIMFNREKNSFKFKYLKKEQVFSSGIIKLHNN